MQDAARAGVAATSVPLLPRAFQPPFSEGTQVINVTCQPGISLAESDALGRVAEGLLLLAPEVRGAGRRTGRAELDEHAEGIHSYELDLDLREGGRPRAAVLADIRGRLVALPAAMNIGQPISHRLDHILSGMRAQIARSAMLALIIWVMCRSRRSVPRRPSGSRGSRSRSRRCSVS